MYIPSSHEHVGTRADGMGREDESMRTITVMEPAALRALLNEMSDVCLDASVENTFTAYAEAVGTIEDMIYRTVRELNAAITEAN